MQIKYCIIIGSSRGLGAALVEEFLKQTPYRIIGIARTKLENIKNHEQWIASGRYRHIEMDIASPLCREVLKDISMTLSPNSVCVIFNSAHIEKDINKDQTINYTAFDNVNRVGINGIGNILFAFEPHLLKYGGIFVGISSLWGNVPPLYLPYLAYPASKAYLNMALKCLRVAWRKSVKITAVNIGNIKNDGDVGLPKWFIPTYSMGAKKIVAAILRDRPPRVINYPFWHFFIYNYVLRFIPEIAYSWIFGLYLKLESKKKCKR